MTALAATSVVLTALGAAGWIAARLWLGTADTSHGAAILAVVYAPSYLLMGLGGGFGLVWLIIKFVLRPLTHQ